MLAAPRPADGPLPGDLYLDPAVPDCERLVLSRNGWSAQASHVWTGTGWTRLVPGLVRSVPVHPFTTPAAPAAVRVRRTGRRAGRPPVVPAPTAAPVVAAAVGPVVPVVAPVVAVVPPVAAVVPVQLPASAVVDAGPALTVVRRRH